MHAAGFDRMTRALSIRLDRRSIYRLVASGFAAAVVGQSNVLRSTRAATVDSSQSAASKHGMNWKERRHSSHDDAHWSFCNLDSRGDEATPVAPTPGACLPGGESCGIDPITGLADFSQCCSGSGVSSLTTPCLCCENDRTGVRETGEICFPQAGNQCCVGFCMHGDADISGVCA